jgi:glutathione synthase
MSSNKPVRIGVVMDPIVAINPVKDTTLAMMLAAQIQGAELYYMEQDDIYIKDGQARGRLRAVTVYDDIAQWYVLRDPEDVPLSTLDIILMRKDPPVDKRFIHACYVLETAMRNGVRVVNNPLALIDFNEKIFATHFARFSPPYIIGSNREILRDFLDEHQNIVIKPLDSMGGDGVFLVRAGDVNFDVIWEIQTQRGHYPVVAQRFIPEISNGDKRIVLFNGKPFEYALVRLPREGSIRGNLAAGGSYDVQPLTSREKEIAEEVGRTLVGKGIAFAGLDVIGDYLTEVNITSPTGLRQLASVTGQDVAGMLMREIIHNPL